MIIPRLLYIICKGTIEDRISFSKYLQTLKKNTYRLCVEEIQNCTNYNKLDIIIPMIDTMISDGDVALDYLINDTTDGRRTFLWSVRSAGIPFRAYAYVIKTESNRIFEQPMITEGFDKVMSVAWDRSPHNNPEIIIVSDTKESPAVKVKKTIKAQIIRHTVKS